MLGKKLTNSLSEWEPDDTEGSEKWDLKIRDLKLLAERPSDDTVAKMLAVSLVFHNLNDEARGRWLRMAKQEFLQTKNIGSAAARADFELAHEQDIQAEEEDNSEMADISTENDPEALDRMEARIRRDPFYSKELDRLIERALGLGQTRAAAREIAILEVAGRMEKKSAPPLAGAHLLTAPEASERLLQLTETIATTLGLKFSQALEEAKALSPELTTAAAGGPRRPRVAARISTEADPRETLNAMAQKIAAEKKIDFNAALEEVKLAAPDLIKRVGKMYDTTV